MNTNVLYSNISQKTFSRMQLFETAKKMDSSFKDSQLKFYISAMLKENLIVRIGHGINSKTENSKVYLINAITEAPVSEGGNTSIEKLAVDLFANKILSKLISRGDYPQVLEEKYQIKENKRVDVNRYCRTSWNVSGKFLKRFCVTYLYYTI